jgi:hypothetical protein
MAGRARFIGGLGALDPIGGLYDIVVLNVFADAAVGLQTGRLRHAARVGTAENF